MADDPNVFKTKPEDYGELYKNHLFEIYKIFVQSAESISDRRHKANFFFLTLNSALVTLASSIKYDETSVPNFIIPLVGIFIGCTWHQLIKSYRDLNSAKLKIICEIEKKLPLAVYETEWAYLGQGKNSQKYLPFTKIEQIVPWIFVFIHVIVGIYNIFKLLS